MSTLPVVSTERLRQAREAAGLTQEQAAPRVEVTRGTLQLYEAGRRRPRADVLAGMARLYGVPLESLFIHDSEADTPSTTHGKPNGGAAAGRRSTPVVSKGA